VKNLGCFFKVVLRYQFNYSLYWSEEVARYLIIFFIFIGSSIAVREKAHASVDALVAFVPQSFKKIFAIIATLIAMVFTGIIVVAGWGFILKAKSFGSVTPSLGIPMYIPLYIAYLLVCLSIEN
jgi:C4-dicarboxylate transporter DctQ subunit